MATFIDRIYGISNATEAKTIYDDWASTYDKDVGDKSQNYVGPIITTAYLLDCLETKSIDPGLKILDAGCGTGLVGVCLAKAGAGHVDGVDLSPGMLDVARQTGAYKNLQPADLSQPINLPDSSYDAITCVGTLTQGHVGPEPLADFVRIAKPGGFILATILDTIWESGGYATKVKSLAEEGKVKIVKAQVEDYRPGAGLRAMTIALQKST